MNFLNDCSEEVSEEKCTESCRKRTPADLSKLRNCTVLAMSNLLNANIDSGLMHSIGMYHVIFADIVRLACVNYVLTGEVHTGDVTNILFWYQQNVTIYCSLN